MKYLDAIRLPGRPENFAHLPQAEIVAGIAEISEQLKRPMSNTERAALVMDRKDLRARLAQLPTS